MTVNDLSIFKFSSPDMQIGDVIVLSAGSVTTTSLVANAAPADGMYPVYLLDNGTKFNGAGAVVPEPATLSALGLAGIGLLARRRLIPPPLTRLPERQRRSTHPRLVAVCDRR